MREINVKPQTILLEPFGRNTCPAVTLAALSSLKRDKDSYLLVLAADHEIINNEIFIKSIMSGLKYCDSGRLVTFGIMPTHPETGYGYIKSKEPLNYKSFEGSEIASFFEKPNLLTAKKFIKDRTFSWNSGIFLFRAKDVIKEIERFQPRIIESCKKAILNSNFDLDFQRIENDAFQECPDISLDNAVFEKTEKAVVIPLNSGWSDLGNWNTLWDLSEKDNKGNTKIKNSFLVKTKNCFLQSENKLIVTLGIQDLVIIDSNDAILVSQKKHLQELKEIVKKLSHNGFSQAEIHKKVHRPWGNYESIATHSNWQVKLINLNPGGSISLQKHKFRTEHWIVLKGKAEIQIEDKKFILKENQSTFIPKNTLHRLKNLCKENLEIVEVQSGSYLGEDDIERFEDIYGRIDNLKNALN